MSTSPKRTRHPEASFYRRNASRLTTRDVLHPLEKEELIAEAPFLRRKRAREELEAAWAKEEQLACEEA